MAQKSGEIWTGPNNAVGSGVGSRSDTRRAESMEGFRMLLQPVHLKSDRLLAHGEVSSVRLQAPRGLHHVPQSRLAFRPAARLQAAVRKAWLEAVDFAGQTLISYPVQEVERVMPE